MTDVSIRSCLAHRSWLWICLIALVSTGFVVVPKSYAMQFQVSKSSDSDDGVCDSDCSLREAIVAANANPGPDTISLNSLTYTLSLGPSSGLLISDDLTITGVQSSTTIIDAQNSSRIFSIDEDVTVTLKDLTLRNGSSAGNGGAILSWGDLSLANITIESNSASYGGAIYSADGSLKIETSLLRANQASTNGGTILISEGGLAISESLFTANQADGHGGAIYIKDSGATLDRLTFTNNQAEGDGGAIYLQSSDLKLSNSSFVGNKSGEDGGALASVESRLTIDSSSFRTNSSEDDGGALALNEVSHGSLTKLELVNNRAQEEGGGIYHDLASSFEIRFSNLQANEAASGGAIYNLGQLVLGESSVVSNSASLAGGGLLDASAQSSSIRNSTLSSNQSAAHGGAVAKIGSGQLRIIHATIAYNSAQLNGGGVALSQGSLTISHTLLAENSAAHASDCWGNINSEGYNLIQTAAGCTIVNSQTSDILHQAAQLQALALNGGSTLSHALASSSPALDAGSALSNECEALDQRGVQRPQGGRCDIGSLEQIHTLSQEQPFKVLLPRIQR
jgi:CSLREA domain-containing protein